MRSEMYLIIAMIFFAGILAGCGKDDDNAVDREPPTIDVGFTGAFPVQCSELKRGESFILKARFADNVALGSFSVDIHHNFDHHNHSTEVNTCEFGPVKQPIKPFLFIQSYDIPGGSKNYETNVEIAVPEDIDTGDYHFMIMVTDREGWSKMVGLSIKIV